MPMSSVELYIRKNLKHNVTVNMLDAMFFGSSLGFGSFGTVIPLFMMQFTNSATLIGLIPAIHAVGWQLPQLFTANRVSSLRRYKPHVMRMTINERLPFVGFAILAWFSFSMQSQWVILIAFLLLIWQGFGAGFTANPWQSFIAKIIPGESRGTFFGMQAAVANIAIAATGIMAGYMLTRLDSPLDFALTFIITFIFMVISWAFLGLSREPVDHDKVIPENMPPIWAGAKELLKRDRNFSWFLVARLVAMFASMGFAFYIIYGRQAFGMDELTASLLLTVTPTLAQTFANASMGWMSDRMGHRLMLIIGAISISLSAALVWMAPNINWFYPALVLAGIANVATWTIGMAMTVEFGTEVERPVYIGLSNTLVAPATILGPLLGGWIADTAGFHVTFGISVVGGLITALILWLMVKNPRDLKIPLSGANIEAA